MKKYILILVLIFMLFITGCSMNKNVMIDDIIIFVKSDDYWGAINVEGETLIKFKYDSIIAPVEASNFDEIFPPDGVIQAQYKGKWGLIDYSGTKLSDFLFDDKQYFYKELGIKAALLDGKWGIYDLNENFIIEHKYDSYRVIVDLNLIALEYDGHWALSDLSGNLLTEFKYDFIKEYTSFCGEDEIEVGFNDEKFCLNQLGEETLKIERDENYSSPGKPNGSTSIPKSRDEDGLYPIYNEGLCGYENIDNEVLIDSIYQMCDKFYDNGIALTQYKGLKGGIDKNGETVIEFIYHEMVQYPSRKFFQLYAVRYNGKWGFLDKDGNMVIECEYDDIYPHFKYLGF